MRRVLADPSFRRERVQADLDGLGIVVETGSPPWSGDDVVGLLSFEPVTGRDLSVLPSLRVVATPSVGFDHIDVAAATERGVWVCNVPDYCVEEMADHTVALLLALARGVVELDRSVRDGGWDHLAAGRLGRLADIRLGIVGYGRIGRAAAARARALGMDVAAFDPLLEPDVIASTGARPMSLDELLSWSTAISLHAPLTPDAQHLVGARELALLPEGAYVVNVARAGLVDSDALLAALASGHLGGVAIDVLDVEPPDAAAPAPQAPRLVVNPHAGWYSEKAEEAAPRRATESVRDVLEGRVPATAVNEVASSVR